MSTTKSSSSSSSSLSGGGGGGGLKGILKSTGKFCYSTAVSLSSNGKIWIKQGYTIIGSTAFGIATTSMIVLMPLLFEIAREAQMLETERSLIKDLRSRGFSDRQLTEMGYSDNALHTPSVASLPK